MEKLADDIAAASAAYGVSTWPESAEARVRFLHDLVFSSIIVFHDLLPERPVTTRMGEGR